MKNNITEPGKSGIMTHFQFGHAIKPNIQVIVKIILVIILLLLALTMIGQTQTKAESSSEHIVKFTKEPFSSENPCKVGDLVIFEAEAADSKGHKITYEWRDNCGQLHFIDPDKSRTIWFSLEEGDWLIYLKATCEKGKSVETQFHQSVMGYIREHIGILTE